MKTLVIKSETSLVNPPANTPVFSAIPYTPAAVFNAKKLVSSNTAGLAVNLPFSFDGSGSVASRTFDSAGTLGAPVFSNEDGLPCLSFNGNQGVGQTNAFTLKKGFTFAVVAKVDEYIDQINSRILAIGADTASRSFIRVLEGGISPQSGSGAAYTDPLKPKGFFSIVVKFNGANSKFVDANGNLVNISLQETTVLTSSYLRMGTSLSSTTVGGFKGKIAGWKIYQDDLSDLELIELQQEMKLLYSL